MKPVDFGYIAPRTVSDAIQILSGEPRAKIIAGGQTLGPMLNLRLARPSLLVDITRIPDMVRVEVSADGMTLGACITHAAIEDGRVPDVTRGFLPAVAHGIAYRAVRNRGTIGGSLAHGDPAADWLSALMALDAAVIIAGPADRQRRQSLTTFARGAMTTALAADEIITGVNIPNPGPATRWGYHKICRKTGEFAEAIGIVIERGDGRRRCVAGATGGVPIILAGAIDEDRLDWRRVLSQSGYKGDAYDLEIHAIALERATAEAFGRGGQNP